MNICPVGAKLLHMGRRTDRRADGQTGGQMDRQEGRRTDRRADLTNLIVALHNSANLPKTFIVTYSCPLSTMSV